MNITIAGDEKKFCQTLRESLESQNYRVQIIIQLAAALKTLEASPPQLLTLAPTALKESVMKLLRAIRQNATLRLMPILCINPRGAETTGVKILDAGADDFINRPFNPQIFLARVRTLLRRRIWAGNLGEDSVTSLQFGPLLMRLISRQVAVSGRPILLTRLEFDLLAYLLRHVDRAFKRQDLLAEIWNYPEQVETRTLDKHVETLRKKLGVCGSAIQTVHAIGYRFAPAAFNGIQAAAEQPFPPA